MSGLNTYFVPLTILQEQFWDKLTDAPLAGGKLYFFQDEARTIPKPIYVLTGSPPDYTYAVTSPSATSITLSSIGTVNDSSGNNLVIYGYPYDDTEFDGSGNIQLYYMTAYDSDGSFEFSVGGFPNVPYEENEQASGHEKNFIKNGQFVLNDGAKSISATSTKLAYGDWNYIRSSNTATDAVSFIRFGSPIAGGSPSANPRYSCNVSCTVTGTDSYKALEVRFSDVNRFSDTVQTLSLFFEATSSVNSIITVDLYKYFGSGGSSPVSTQIVDSTTLDSTWTPVTCSFPFGSNIGKTIGPNNDDYFSIRVIFPPTTTFNISTTDFVLYLGSELITAYPFGTNSYNDQKIYNLSIPYNAYLSSSFTLSLNTSWQAITGTSITLQPGIYLISYNCSLVLTVGPSGSGYEALSAIFNTTTALVLDNTICTCLSITSNVSIGNVGTAGTGSATIPLAILVPTTLQIYAQLSLGTNSHEFTATYANINAMQIG